MTARLDAKVVGTDPKTDLALIKVDGNKTSPSSNSPIMPRGSATG